MEGLQDTNAQISTSCWGLPGEIAQELNRGYKGHCEREVRRRVEVAAVQPTHLQRTWEEWCRSIPVPYVTQSNMSLYNHSLLTLQGRIQDPHDTEKQEFEGKCKGEFLTVIFWLAFLGPKHAFRTQDIHHNYYT